MTRRTTLFVTCGAVALVLLTVLFWPNKLRPSAAAEGDPPEQVELIALVRDFSNSHPDFGNPPAGSGHCAANVVRTVDDRHRPVFAPGGYVVLGDWRDGLSRPIAPHLYVAGGPAPGVIPLVTATVGPADGFLDTWDSSAGPYDPLTAGPPPIFDVGAPMPEAPDPGGLALLPNQGDVNLPTGGTLDAEMHCERLTLDGTIAVSGRVSVLCEGLLSIMSNCEIQLLPDSTLTLYLRQGADVNTWGHVNGNTSDPNRLRISNLGTAPILLRNHSNVYATIVSPEAPMEIDNHAEFFGKFVGLTIDFRNHGSLHLDLAPARDACGNLLADTAGSAGVASDGGITSAATYHQWYRDILGTNLSSTHRITLDRSAGGIYEYLSDAFHPIDGRLFGNEGDPHNTGFTYSLDASFEYDPCAAQFVEFEGGDGAWMFVNGALVMDLGGVESGSVQVVDLDRLGLSDGVPHRMQLFYAQRRASSTVFRLRTNVELASRRISTPVTEQYD